MRFIYIDKIKLPEGWKEKAHHAKEAVENHRKSVNKFSSVWQELKDALAELSHGKCWYCECKQIRSDNAVDHFRPKSKYLWLAFDYKNYRYSCTLCNSKRKNPKTHEIEGKGDEFPLIDESKRVNDASGSLNQEAPLLLDPCKSNDVCLLDFRDDGSPCPRYQDDEIKKKRAEVSIKHYHLDHPDLVEKRKELALEIKQKIEEIDDSISGHPDIEPSESLMQDLHRFMNESSELSAFARRIIRGYRDRPWIDDLFCTT